jgi:hypothetical protein
MLRADTGVRPAGGRVQAEAMKIDIVEHEPPYRVGVIVGSLSRESINRRLATALQRLAPPELEFFEIGYGDLPLYNRDLDSDYPQEALDFKAAVRSADALLFVTRRPARSARPSASSRCAAPSASSMRGR